MFARLATTRFVSATLIALALIGAARPAAAQATAPAANAPSPAAVLLAKQILDLKHVKQLFEPMIDGVIIRARDSFTQTNFMWAKDLNDVANILKKQYEPRADELVNTAARDYASHFTEPELKQLLAFYQSPLGQKVIAEEPKALDESMANAGNWIRNTFQLEVIDSMREEMKKRGHDI